MPKYLNGVVANKTDTKAHWDSATTFIPLKGEIIVYSDGNGGSSTPLIKIGDGVTLLANLPFSSGDSLPSQEGQSGKYLTTNGTLASWSTVNTNIYIYSNTEPTDKTKIWCSTFEKPVIEDATISLNMAYNATKNNEILEVD